MSRDPDRRPAPGFLQRAAALEGGAVYRYHRAAVLDEGRGLLGEIVLIERRDVEGGWIVSAGLSSVRRARCDRFRP